MKTAIFFGALLISGGLTSGVAAKPPVKIAPYTAFVRSMEHPPKRKGVSMQVNGEQLDCYAMDSYHSKNQTMI